jgi:hypothetical protein
MPGLQTDHQGVSVDDASHGPAPGELAVQARGVKAGHEQGGGEDECVENRAVSEPAEAESQSVYEQQLECVRNDNGDGNGKGVENNSGKKYCGAGVQAGLVLPQLCIHEVRTIRMFPRWYQSEPPGLPPDPLSQGLCTVKPP